MIDAAHNRVPYYNVLAIMSYVSYQLHVPITKVVGIFAPTLFERTRFSMDKEAEQKEMYGLLWSFPIAQRLEFSCYHTRGTLVSSGKIIDFRRYDLK